VRITGGINFFWHDTLINKRILHQLALPFERLAGIPGIFHEGDFLRDKAGEVEGVRIDLCGLSFVERMVAVDINRGLL
jgi:hypothetical protein